MLNKAHMMEITKENKVPFRKAIDSLVAQYREECVNWQKNRIVKKKKNFKLPANRFSLTSKSCSWFNKLVYRRPSIRWTPWKGNDMLLKVD